MAGLRRLLVTVVVGVAVALVALDAVGTPAGAEVTLSTRSSSVRQGEQIVVVASVQSPEGSCLTLGSELPDSVAMSIDPPCGETGPDGVWDANITLTAGLGAAQGLNTFQLVETSQSGVVLSTTTWDVLISEPILIDPTIVLPSLPTLPDLTIPTPSATSSTPLPSVVPSTSLVPLTSLTTQPPPPPTVTLTPPTTQPATTATTAASTAPTTDQATSSTTTSTTNATTSSEDDLFFDTEIRFSAPPQMQLNETASIVLVINPEDATAPLPTITAPGTTQQADISTSCKTTARLSGPANAFTIVEATEGSQNLCVGQAGSWEWLVTAAKEGDHRMRLVISAEVDGSAVGRKVFSEDIDVSVPITTQISDTALRLNWILIGGIFGGIGTAVVTLAIRRDL